VFGRLGGEEFVTLLPNTEAQDVIWLAEQIRVAIEAASPTVEAHTVRMTVGAGVASLIEGTTALDAFLGTQISRSFGLKQPVAIA
jgi:diguanylate cyclase (GGDEF)-like protein